VGGTAIALYLGHRRSIDFDLFKPLAINHKRNLDKITAASFPHTVTRRVAEQMNLIVNDVKVTFFQYPFPVEPTAKFETYFRLPSLLQLAAMKACAFGRRSKWKDYVDLYFLLRDHFTIADITHHRRHHRLRHPPLRRTLLREDVPLAALLLRRRGLHRGRGLAHPQSPHR